MYLYSYSFKEGVNGILSADIFPAVDIHSITEPEASVQVLIHSRGPTTDTSPTIYPSLPLVQLDNKTSKELLGFANDFDAILSEGKIDSLSLFCRLLIFYSNFSYSYCIFSLRYWSIWSSPTKHIITSTTHPVTSPTAREQLIRSTLPNNYPQR